MIQYEWTQPIGGRKIIWRPLTIGQELDIVAGNSREERKHLIPAMMLGARVVMCGEDKGLPYSKLRDWDDIDFAEFAEEVSRVELLRREACRKNQPNAITPVAQLEAAVQDFQIYMDKAVTAIKNIVDYAKTVEAQQSGPLV